jgi:hypothetical protein
MMRYSVTLTLVCLAGLLGACGHATRNDSSAGMLASREVPKLEKVETRPSLGSTPKSAMKLSYDSGAALDLKFDSTKYDVVNVEDGSGITIFNGFVQVNAVLPKDTKTRITAPTFWPIIRTKQVVIGAEGTEFVVNAINQPAGADGRTLVAKVHMISGTKVKIYAPEKYDELTTVGSQANVWQLRDGSHEIEKLAQLDAELRQAIQELNQGVQGE